MPKIIVKQPFSYFHGGHARRDYEPAPEAVETDDECAGVAVSEGWADLDASDEADASELEQAPLPAVDAESRAMKAAPENKDAAAQRATKASA